MGYNDSELVASFNDWFAASESDDRLSEWRREAAEDFSFYYGGSGQWTSAALSKLRAENRSILTYNYVQSRIRLLCGYQRQNRLEIRVVGVEGDTDDARAQFLGEVLHNLIYLDDHNWTASRVFQDAAICGLGWLSLYMDYSRDLLGELRTEDVDPLMIYPDPGVEYPDYRDGEFVIRKKLWSRARADSTYPEFHLRPNGDGYVELFESQWKERIVEHYAVSREGEAQRFEKKRDALDFARSQPGMWEVRSAPVPYVRLGVLSNNEVLERSEGNDAFPLPEFSYVPLHCLFLRGNSIGVARGLKDPQRVVNKMMSKGLDIVNASPLSGWIVERGALVDKKQIKNIGAQANPVIEVVPNKRFDRIPPPILEPALVQALQLAQSAFDDISGISPIMMGLYDRSSSGQNTALMLGQGQAVTGEIFDNFRLFARSVGRQVIAYVQKYYTGRRLIRIVGADAVKLFQINSAPEVVEQATTPEDAVKILRDVGVGRYDVVVSEAPASPTLRQANFGQLVEMAKATLQAAPQAAPLVLRMLVENSELQDKEKWYALLEQLAGPPPETGGVMPTPMGNG